MANKNDWQSANAAGRIKRDYQDGEPIMKKLGMLGIIGAAAILTAAPLSLQWSQTSVALSLDSAQAREGRPLYRYGSADCGYIPYGTSYAAPCGVYPSSYSLAYERLQAGYALPYRYHGGPSNYLRRFGIYYWGCPPRWSWSFAPLLPHSSSSSRFTAGASDDVA